MFGLFFLKSNYSIHFNIRPAVRYYLFVNATTLNLVGFKNLRGFFGTSTKSISTAIRFIIPKALRKLIHLSPINKIDNLVDLDVLTR